MELFSIDVGSIGLSYRVCRSIWARSNHLFKTSKNTTRNRSYHAGVRKTVNSWFRGLCSHVGFKRFFRGLGLILAHPSSTFPENWGSHAEGVRHGTFADAHPPRDNLTFQEKCWKGVPKSSPESIFPRKNLLKPTRELNPRKSRFCCFSRSRMVAAISRRVFRCFEKVIFLLPRAASN